MPRSALLQINTSAPYLSDRVHCRGDHSWERFQTVELDEVQCGKCCLNGLTQSFFIDRARETSSESRRKLFESENVQPVLALPRGI
jgi:hypothetical protein